MGNGMCQILSEFHSITGCNTTSYPFFEGKINHFKKCMVSVKCICYRMWGKTFYIQSKKIKLLSLQRSDSTKIQNTKTFPD